MSIFKQSTAVLCQNLFPRRVALIRLKKQFAQQFTRSWRKENIFLMNPMKTERFLLFYVRDEEVRYIISKNKNLPYCFVQD